MSVLKRRNDLVQDLVNETEQYKSWDILELATWDAVHDKVNEVLQIHETYGMMDSADAMVGLDQAKQDRIWIEVDVVWEKGRDADNFVIFLIPDGHGNFSDWDLAEDYDRAMGVV